MLSSIVLAASFASSVSLAAAPSDLEPKYGPRPVDGVYVEAVQEYIAPKKNQVELDFGIWPLQPYYNGFSIDVSDVYHFSKSTAWEIANLSYLYTVDTGLTQELASNHGVTPQSIERMNYIVSSNYLWDLIYGKFLLFENNIRYFRSGFLVGPALMISDQKSYVGACVGWSFETFASDRMSWKAQIRDNYAAGSNYPHNLVFSLGTTYGF